MPISRRELGSFRKVRRWGGSGFCVPGKNGRSLSPINLGGLHTVGSRPRGVIGCLPSMGEKASFFLLVRDPAAVRGKSSTGEGKRKEHESKTRSQGLSP